jgi:hypothetical protein
MPNNYLSFHEKSKLHAIIKEFTEKDGPDFVRFKDDHTDVTVAEIATQRLGRLVTNSNVAGMRKENVGNLRKKGNIETLKLAWAAHSAKAAAKKAAEAAANQPTVPDATLAALREEIGLVFTAVAELKAEMVLLRQAISSAQPKPAANTPYDRVHFAAR